MSSQSTINKYFYFVSGMLQNFVNIPPEVESFVKTEYEEEDDHVDIIDNLKQEHTQTEENEPKCENFINLTDETELANSTIKQEDPLSIVDDLKQEESSESNSNQYIEIGSVPFSDKCDESFPPKQHLNLRENVRYYCDNCDQSFSYQTQLKGHIRRVHKKIQYNCPKCEKAIL